MVIPQSSRLSDRTEENNNEFHACCLSLARRIDDSIWNDEVPANAQELALTLKNVCQHTYDDQTSAVIMTLMLSAKSACELGWFPQRESEELLALVDSMLKSFTGPENVASSLTLNGSVSLIPQVMERFYPFLKLRHILVSSEADAESFTLMESFHISTKILKISPRPRVGLFVFRTEDISNSSCIIHPQEVSFTLNGSDVDNRHIKSMDSRPQRPTDLTNLLITGTNLLQTIGSFGGSYFIVIAIFDDIPLPVYPSLKDYVRSDCDITKGPSRISLSCPISHTRIKLPVKGHACKHLQCFDFWNYIKTNTKIPSWCCPHCHQSVCYADIRLDQNMIKILDEVKSNAPDVVISPDGSWRVVTEKDENVEATHQHGDPTSSQNLGPPVLDLPGRTQENKLKRCVFRRPMINESSDSMEALPQTLNVYDEQQQFMNFPVSAAAGEVIRMPLLPTSSPQDRVATDTGSSHMSMLAAHSSQFQGLHLSPLGLSLGRTSDLRERSNHVYGDSITQTQLPSMQERPIPSSITYPQTFAFNFGGISDQRPVQRQNPGGAGEQFSSREFMNLTPDNSANRPPQIRTMRGSITPGSSRYDHLIIQPTRPVQSQAQTLPPPQPTAYNYVPVQSQAQTLAPPQPTAYSDIPVQSQAQTLPPPQPTAYSDIPVQSQAQTLAPPQAFLVDPSYPVGTNETPAGTGSLPVLEGVLPLGSFWSMPPEAW